MIAMALSCDPEVLIADEPTTALDVTIQAQILELMNEMQARLGSAIIMITHDLGVVAETCQNVLVMYAREHGRVRYRDADLQRAEAPLHDGTLGLAAAPRREVARPAGTDRRASRRICCVCRPAAPSRRAARYRMPVCDQPVPLYDFGDGHVARCFLYDAATESERPLKVASAPKIPDSEAGASLDAAVSA